ncbi:hypothetical protein F5Y04DRAFT_266348 [Hypomontagnella monticulosa]|nr:hypothetical protein F5Y04DRAFT_266348 [Hypomontagnella monticulosa]
MQLAALSTSSFLDTCSAIMPFDFFKNKNKHPPDWVPSVLRCTYNDGRTIKKGLDGILGDKNYVIKHRTGRWVVWAPRKLSTADESKLEGDAHVHYDSQSGPRNRD